MRTVFLASLRTHTRRYVAATVAVVVSVAFVVVIGVLNAGARRGLMDSLGARFRKAGQPHLVGPPFAHGRACEFVGQIQGGSAEAERQIAGGRRVDPVPEAQGQVPVDLAPEIDRRPPDERPGGAGEGQAAAAFLGDVVDGPDGHRVARAVPGRLVA